jgi:broad specificity phosphatase PhoE
VTAALPTSIHWPSVLWIVRHGQSAANVARDAALSSGAERIVLTGRDVDVPLSELGERQAKALGRWFAEGGSDCKPEVLLASPYTRAVQTAHLFRDSGGCDADEEVLIDERLREREKGILDGLTPEGVRHYEPQQADLVALLGKFYHRPPGGESWADVILRLRGLLDTVSLHYRGQRVMIVAHHIVTLCLRYIIEGMGESELLGIDKQGAVANCSVTEYRFDPKEGKRGKLVLACYNVTAPMEDQSTEVTSARDPIVGVRG